MAPRGKAGEHERVRHLLALDAETVARRIEERAEDMLSLFSRLRDRDALLWPLATRFETVPFAQLALFEPAQQQAIHAFYDRLEALRWYFSFTTDMPGALQDRFTQHRLRLGAAYAKLVESIGLPLADNVLTLSVAPSAVSGKTRAARPRQKTGTKTK